MYRTTGIGEHCQNGLWGLLKKLKAIKKNGVQNQFHKKPPKQNQEIPIYGDFYIECNAEGFFVVFLQTRKASDKYNKVL